MTLFPRVLSWREAGLTDGSSLAGDNPNETASSEELVSRSVHPGRVDEIIDFISKNSRGSPACKADPPVRWRTFTIITIVEKPRRVSWQRYGGAGSAAVQAQPQLQTIGGPVASSELNPWAGTDALPDG